MQSPAILVVGFAPKRSIPSEYVDHIRKHIPILRSYGLEKAADHLEQWVGGTLALAPALDISAFMGSSHTKLYCHRFLKRIH